MKRISYGVLLLISLSLILMNVGAITKGAPCFAYVYSDSMEPTIRINDGFLVWPAKTFQTGDIVYYRPVKLKAELITHRIVDVGETGFITKGDNSPVTDQAAGEPELELDRIVGKVVTYKGAPLIIPGFGNLIAGIYKFSGAQARIFSGVLITAGIVLALMDTWFPQRYKRKARRRLRLRDLYRALAVIVVGVTIFGVLLGSRVYKVSYLVSENPGDAGNHIRVNETGQLDLKMKNYSLVPVWQIGTGIAPFELPDAPEIIPPMDQALIAVKVLPQQELGWKNGYVHIYHYPLVMPGKILLILHRQSPALALAGIGIAFALWLMLLIKLLNQIHGLEGWVPLRAFKDKIGARRWQSMKTRYLKKRRSPG